MDNVKFKAAIKRVRFLYPDEFHWPLSVPDYVYRAMFGEKNYRNRLVIAVFCFINGIHIQHMIRILLDLPHRFASQFNIKLPNSQQIRQITDLWKDFEEGKYLDKYYGFDVHRNIVVYLNGLPK